MCKKNGLKAVWWAFFKKKNKQTKNKDIYKGKINSSHCILYIQTLDLKIRDGGAQNVLKVMMI